MVLPIPPHVLQEESV